MGRSNTYFKRQEPSATMTLWVILLFAVVTYSGYHGWQQWSSAARAVPTSSPAMRPGLAASPRVSSAPPIHVPAPPMQHSAPAGNHVVKCVAGGATTYVASASDCGVAAKASVVSINRHENLIQGLPNAAQVIRTPSPQVQAQVHPPQAPAAHDSSQKKALCLALEAEIKAIDSRARQPLTAQEQDWLKEKRKNARDQQFRLRC